MPEKISHSPDDIEEPIRSKNIIKKSNPENGEKNKIIENDNNKFEEYENYKKIYIDKIKDISPAVAQKIESCLESYKKFDNPKAEVYIFNLITRSGREFDDYDKKRFGNEGIAEWQSMILDLINREEFKTVLKKYPSLSESALNYVHKECDEYHTLYSLFRDGVKLSAFKEDRFNIGKDAIGSLVDALASPLCISILNDLTVQARKAKANKYLDKGWKEAKGRYGKYTSMSDYTEEWLIKFVSKQVSSIFSNKVNGRIGASGNNDIYNGENDFESVIKFILPSLKDCIQKYGSKIFTPGRPDEPYTFVNLDSKLDYDWPEWDKNVIGSLFYDYARAYEHIPSPENIGSVIALDAEGRIAGRMIKRFWNEKKYEKQPKIYYINPKFISPHRYRDIAINQDEAKLLLLKEFPSLIKELQDDNNNNNDDVLIIDATAQTGGSLQRMGNLVELIIKGHKRIKYWTLTGINDPFRINDPDWKVHHTGHSGMESPDLNPGANPSFISKKSKKYNPAKVAMLTKYALDIFYNIQEAKDDFNKQREIVRKLIEDKQYCLISEMILHKTLPFSKKEVEEIIALTIQNGDLKEAENLIRGYRI